MTVKKKLDNSYRISIPAEMLAKMNASIGDELNMETKGNGIILYKSEKVSGVILNNAEEESRLGEVLASISNEEIPAMQGEPIKLSKKYRIETRCHVCLSELKDSKFKLNGNYICRDCRDALKEQLIFDIAHKNY